MTTHDETERKKPRGIARTGQAAAVTVIVMIVPIMIFILSESQILETMASSGLKD